MNEGQFERRVEFIIEQQAQFVSDMQQLRQSQAQTDSVVARLAHATLEGFKDTIEGFKDTNAKIEALVDAHIRLADSQDRTDEEMRKTDEKLRNLLAVVDRYFKARNGSAPSKDEDDSA
jgi:two-component sensor histidine kinase